MLTGLLLCHVAYFMPKGTGRMVVAEAFDFPGVARQGFDLADARSMVASALEEMAAIYLEEGKALPRPSESAAAPDADLIELIPRSVEAGTTRP